MVPRQAHHQARTKYRLCTVAWQSWAGGGYCSLQRQISTAVAVAAPKRGGWWAPRGGGGTAATRGGHPSHDGRLCCRGGGGMSRLAGGGRHASTPPQLTVAHCRSLPVCKHCVGQPSVSRHQLGSCPPASTGWPAAKLLCILSKLDTCPNLIETREEQRQRLEYCTVLYIQMYHSRPV